MHLWGGDMRCANLACKNKEGNRRRVRRIDFTPSSKSAIKKLKKQGRVILCKICTDVAKEQAKRELKEMMKL